MQETTHRKPVTAGGKCVGEWREGVAALSADIPKVKLPQSGSTAGLGSPEKELSTWWLVETAQGEEAEKQGEPTDLRGFRGGMAGEKGGCG